MIKEKLNILDIYTEPVKELYDIFHSVPENEHLVLSFTLAKNNKIIRLRINEQDKLFFNKSELSYPPNEFVLSYGRTNLPKHSMFYGSVFPNSYDQEKDPNLRMVVAAEVSAMLRNTSSEGIEKQTYSVWITKDDLKLIALPFSSKYENPCKAIEDIQNHWNSLISKFGVSQEAKDLAKFMSNEIAKEVSNHKEYFIIANYIYYLLYINNETKKYDGIIYPTVPLQGAGFNIALKSEIVDAKLQFIQAGEGHMIKRKMESTILCVKDLKLINENGDLSYSESSEFNLKKKELYAELEQGLVFVN
ncbi:MAG: hypothetical protein LBR81_09605 [Prevotellaceae bacterium]|jgi:hypothetical protein|nr:hypothetical protein [Prevotellaceae bacterium]